MPITRSLAALACSAIYATGEEELPNASLTREVGDRFVGEGEGSVEVASEGVGVE